MFNPLRALGFAALTFFAFVSSSQTAHAQDGMVGRTVLERSYSAWRTSMITKDGGAWERATAKSRKVKTKNLMISQNAAFPKALFEVPIRPPSVLQLRCLDQQETSERAQLVYFGKVDMGVGGSEIPNGLLVLRFIKEGEATWLFDSMRYAKLAGMEAAVKRLAAGDASVLEDGDFELKDEPVVVPTLVAYPDYVGHIQVTLSGYKARVTINGHDCGTVDNANVTNVVIGGFRKGKNEMKVEVVKLPLEDESKRYFGINAYVLTGKKDEPRARIFKYRPEDMSNIPSHMKTDIWANAVTIQGRGDR